MKYGIRIVVMAVLAALVAHGAGDGDAGLRRGLVAHYFADPDRWNGLWPDTVSVPQADPVQWTFREYAYSRVEPLINHQFIRRGWFSVRWKGVLDPATGEDDAKGKGSALATPPGGHEYVFEIHADDGCRLMIDGKLLIDDWRACWEESAGAVRRSPAIRLAEGPHEIVIEYFQGQSLSEGDRDPMRLYWSSTTRNIPRQIVPASHFWHTEAHARSPAR